MATLRLRPTLHVIEGGDHAADLALAKRVFGGSREASAEVYDRFADRVDATLYRVLGRREPDHEDLVQSVFVQLVQSFRGYQGGCSLGTWVSRVATHTAFNAMRSRQRARAVFDQGPCEDSADREVDPVLLLRVREALAVLGHAKSEAVVLHDLLGHDLVEVAALLGLSVAATQSRVLRARKQLREILADLGPNRGSDHA